MNGKDLLTGMSYMDEASIGALFTSESGKAGRSGKYMKPFAVLAACLCLAVTGMFLHDGKDGLRQEKEPIRIQLAEIELNEAGSVSGDRRIHLPSNCVEEVWDRETVAAYFGRDLQPAYVPEGLTASPYNDKGIAFFLNGKPYLDEMRMDFYTGFDENGAPAWTEHANAEKGFTLTAWKRGLSRDFMWGEDALRISDIDGTEVIFGYRAMDYGPYDEVTHEPAGTYDLYVATFTLGDVHYEFVSHQLPLSEMVKVVTSFICESDAVLVE